MITSLQDRCKIPAMIVIANLPEVKKKIFSSSLSTIKTAFFFEEWRLSLELIMSRTLKKFTPVLKQIIPYNVIALIGVNMLRFASHLKSEFDLEKIFVRNFINSSIFNLLGIIDEEKAARELVKDSRLSSLQKYRIACFYFLNDLIPVLWQDISNSMSSLKKILGSSDREDPAVICSRVLKDKIKLHPSSRLSLVSLFMRDKTRTLSDYKLNYLTYFLQKAFCPQTQNTNVNLNEFKYYWRSLMLSRHCETQVHDKIEDIDFLFQICIQQTNMFFYRYEFEPIKLLISPKFEAHRNIMLLLLRKNSEDLMEILEEYDLTFSFFRCLLFWPFQNLIIKMAELLFPIMDEEDYHCILHDIVDMISDVELGHTYNYRFLLGAFWNKSPDYFKKYVMNVELRNQKPIHRLVMYRGKLLQKLFLIRRFTIIDTRNICLIIDSATPEEKEEFLDSDGFMFHALHFLYNDRFEILDLFINNLNEEKRKEFKKRIVYANFLELVMKKMTLDAANKLVEWVASPNEVECLKQEIIYESFKISDVAIAYVYFNPCFVFLDLLLRWLFYSDEQILHWKINWTCDWRFLNLINDCHNIYYLNRFDTFLRWLGYCDFEIRGIKRDILNASYSKTVYAYFYGYGQYGEYPKAYKNRLYFCSYNKEILHEFIHNIQRYCELRLSQDACVICNSAEEVYFDSLKNRLVCDAHRSCDIMSQEIQKSFFSKLYYDLNHLMCSGLENFETAR